jgi:hypothetical protein
VLAGHPSNSPRVSLDAVDFRRPPLHLQLSQLQADYASPFRGGFLSVFATVARLRTNTDADLFETICQVEETNWMILALMNWCITSVVKLHLRNRPWFLHPSQAQAASSLGPLACLGMATARLSPEAKSLVATPATWRHGVMFIGILSFKPCGTRKARMGCDGSNARRSRASLRPKVGVVHRLSHACVCLLPWVSSWVQIALTPTPTPRPA